MSYKYLGFIYKMGQWLRDEDADISKQSAVKLLNMVEVLLVNIDKNKEESVYKKLNKIVGE